ncbi:MAG: ATP-binding protein [Alkaliphilus sp.]
MAFKNVVGQGEIVSCLEKALIERKTTHAFMIVGVEGLGKKKLAFEVAKGITCESEVDKPCYECKSCLKAAGDTNTNIVRIEEEKTIKIETIRDIQEKIRIKTFDGATRVYIVHDAEKMTVQAQNALLKTLEDPPEKAVIIMTTINENKLLPTIVSRCQLIKLKLIKTEEIQKHLIKRKNISYEQSKAISALANGVVGKAIKILEDESYMRRREEVFKIIGKIRTASVFEVLSSAEFFNEEKENISEILDMLLTWYRDLLIYKETKQLDYIINCDRIEEIILQSNKIEFNSIGDIIFTIEETRANINSNANYQLSLEVMLLNIQEDLKLW